VVYRVAADLVVVVHLAFVLFAVLGALLTLRWRWVAWIHIPLAAWAAFVEFANWICPLTPLENRLRRLAGESGYGGGFLEHYVVPMIYPSGLTRAVQIILGSLVVALNVVVYAWLFTRRGRGARPPG
jgi:hypothetical protein